MTERISRRQMLKEGLMVAGGAAAATPLLLQGGQLLTAYASPAISLPWPEANAIIAQTTVPTFPNATFPVTNYGAKGDGKTDNTAAFAKAIAACNATGGGHVVVPAGTYSTGAIHLLSNVDFHLDAGATLMFNGTASNYPPVLTRYEGEECLNHSPLVYAYGQTNIALTGSGVLDAAGTASWNTGSNRAGVLDPLLNLPPMQRNVVGKLRVTFVEPYNCTNVLIQGVTLRHTQFWNLHPTLCTNVTIDGVTVTAPGRGNSDGCDPESCDHVVINNSSFTCMDDTIAIKSGRNADGRRLHTPCQNIVIMNSRFDSNRGMVAIGSEETGGVQNVYCFNLSSFGANVWAALYIKNNSLRGGFVKNVNMDTIKATTTRSTAPAVIYAIMNYNGETGAFPPVIDQIHVNNMVADHSPYAIRLVGLSSDHIGTVTVSNSTFTSITHQANSVSNVDHLILTNVTINGQPAH
ncbi:MAG TPA: glycosyl hydrolase family 28 protein [Ktedonobacteraceae bacterium]|nr:glycosyl hydrolase family 28 protein [Ktedonobacteraceae bacterium]